jgi:hypothetical protein
MMSEIIPADYDSPDEMVFSEDLQWFVSSDLPPQVTGVLGRCTALARRFTELLHSIRGWCMQQAISENTIGREIVQPGGWS